MRSVFSYLSLVFIIYIFFYKRFNASCCAKFCLRVLREGRGGVFASQFVILCCCYLIRPSEFSKLCTLGIFLLLTATGLFKDGQGYSRNTCIKILKN